MSADKIDLLYKKLSTNSYGIINSADQLSNLDYISSKSRSLGRYRIFFNLFRGIFFYIMEIVIPQIKSVLNGDTASIKDSIAIIINRKNFLYFINDKESYMQFKQHVFPQIENIYAEVNIKNISNDSGVRSVVFIVKSPFFLIAREASYLRRNNFKVFLLAYYKIPDDLREMFNSCFDGIIDEINTPYNMELVTSLLKPSIFHIQCWMWEYHLSRMVVENSSNSICICEFYDLTSVYAPRDELLKVWHSDLVDLDLASEAWLFMHADGIVHRFPEEFIDSICRDYNTKVPHIEMQQYPHGDYVNHNRLNDINTNDPIRLVYAGGLVPRNDAHPEALFPERKHLEAFRKLLQQGFMIDIYVSPYSSAEGDSFVELNTLAKECDKFNIYAGVSPDQLSKTLAAYDFGLLLADIDIMKNKNRPEQLLYAVGTKLFTYAEAGIPVIVNSEYKYMSDIVKKMGIGLSIASTEIGICSSKVKDFNRLQAREKIKLFVENYSMNIMIYKLIDLYNKASIQKFRC